MINRPLPAFVEFAVFYSADDFVTADATRWLKTDATMIDLIGCPVGIVYVTAGAVLCIEFRA